MCDADVQPDAHAANLYLILARFLEAGCMQRLSVKSNSPPHAMIAAEE